MATAEEPPDFDRSARIRGCAEETADRFAFPSGIDTTIAKVHASYIKRF
jgi:hypothetical protein